jgi:hypothetical protein
MCLGIKVLLCALYTNAYVLEVCRNPFKHTKIQLEHTIFAALAQLNLFAAFWGRLVDDYVLVLDGPIADRLKIVDALKRADPGLDSSLLASWTQNHTRNPPLLACTYPTPHTIFSPLSPLYCQGITTDP